MNDAIAAALAFNLAIISGAPLPGFDSLAALLRDVSVIRWQAKERRRYG